MDQLDNLPFHLLFTWCFEPWTTRVQVSFCYALQEVVQNCISQEDIKVEYLQLTQFCELVKKVLGADFISPNMHMHLY